MAKETTRRKCRCRFCGIFDETTGKCSLKGRTVKATKPRFCVHYWQDEAAVKGPIGSLKETKSRCQGTITRNKPKGVWV